MTLPTPSPNRRHFAGIFLLSSAILVLEITLTRMASLMLWYHFAFLVISITLLGFGISGALLAVFPKLSDEPEKRLRQYTFWYAVTALLGYLLVRGLPLDPFKLLDPQTGMLRPDQVAFLGVYYVLWTIPFVFGGLAVGLLLSTFPKRAGALYGADLMGAGVGSLAVVGLISWYGGPASLLAACFLACGAAVLFHPVIDKKAVYIALYAFLILPALFVNRQAIEVPPCPSKALALMRSELHTKRWRQKPEDFKNLYSRWTMIARIDVTETPAFTKFQRYMVGLGSKYLELVFPSGSQFYRAPDAPKPIPPQYLLSIDGDACTMLTKYEGKEAMEFVDYCLYSTAYHLKKNPDVVVIGLGGGADILTALQHEAKSVKGIEINPAIVEATGKVFADWVGHLYEKPNVTIINDEGRSGLSRDQGQYDIVQLSGVDTWSGLASGAYTLSENYLYTVEAFQEYYDHLKPDGVLSIIRYIMDPPRETLRLVTLGITVLEGQGVKEPWRHIAVLANSERNPYGHFLMKKSPYTEEEIANLKAFADLRGFRVIYVPGAQNESEFSRLLTATDRKQFFDDYPYAVAPVFDDSPFFYQYYKWRNLFSVAPGKGGQLGANRPTAELILFVVLLQSLVLSLLFIIGPLWWRKREGLKVEGVLRWTVYFLCLGVGFMFLEIGLMQKLVLFLGHPVYSIAVVLTALLLGTGIGAWWSGKPEAPFRGFSIAVASLWGIMALYLLGLSHFLALFQGSSLEVRILIGALVVFPLGICLGAPFPSAIRQLAEHRAALVPWAWGVNGCASVLGSVLTMMSAMALGFNITLGLGTAIYGVAWLCFRRD